MEEGNCKRSRKVLIAVVAAVIVVAMIVCGAYFYYTSVKLPYDNAVKSYEALAQQHARASANLKDAISDLQAKLSEGEKPLDESTITEAQTTISEAESSIVAFPQMPEKTEEIVSLVSDFQEVPDYKEQIELLEAAKSGLEDSIRQMAQVTNPEEHFIVDRLSKASGVVDIQAVTEDNDPNGNLGKAGGYTAAVYFTSDQVNQDEVYNDGEDGYGPVGKGTDGGGCIEVYETEEDANKRNDYLATFDGSALNVGSHTVIGTVIIRTSDLLKASQQKELEQTIFESLTNIE